MQLPQSLYDQQGGNVTVILRDTIVRATTPCIYRMKLDRWPCHVTVAGKKACFLLGMAQTRVTHILPDEI